MVQKLGASLKEWTVRIFWSGQEPSYRVSLLAEMSCFALMWDARLRCVVFWFKILLSPMFENRIIRRAAEDAISLSRGPWLNNLKDLLAPFGWSDVSGHNLHGISWHEVKHMLSDIAQRKVLESWRKEMVERPKLSVLHAIHSLGECSELGITY